MDDAEKVTLAQLADVLLHQRINRFSPTRLVGCQKWLKLLAIKIMESNIASEGCPSLAYGFCKCVVEAFRRRVGDDDECFHDFLHTVDGGAIIYLSQVRVEALLQFHEIRGQRQALCAQL